MLWNQMSWDFGYHYIRYLDITLIDLEPGKNNKTENNIVYICDEKIKLMILLELMH